MKADSTFEHSQGTRNEMLHRLIQRQGIRENEYAVFFSTGEGKFFPNGPHGDNVEETSGYVLDQSGHIYLFWLGSDPLTHQATLTEWRQVDPEPHWEGSAEYRRTRDQVGLPVAS